MIQVKKWARRLVITGHSMDPAEVARGKQAAERFLRLSPQAAAERILAGIARREPRIVVGRDAAQVARHRRGRSSAGPASG
jgi:hypothetical protein